MFQIIFDFLNSNFVISLLALMGVIGVPWIAVQAQQNHKEATKIIKDIEDTSQLESKSRIRRYRGTKLDFTVEKIQSVADNQAIMLEWTIEVSKRLDSLDIRLSRIEEG